jgi:5-methylcytosine-specific restriction endonuclease McrBC GTP-binding regulatory subunit McrB
MMYAHIKFELNVCNHCRDDFSKFKRDNSVKIQQTITKFYDESKHAISILYMHTERKLKISTFFQSSRGITLSKINEP